MGPYLESISSSSSSSSLSKQNDRFPPICTCVLLSLHNSTIFPDSSSRDLLGLMQPSVPFSRLARQPKPTHSWFRIGHASYTGPVELNQKFSRGSWESWFLPFKTVFLILWLLSPAVARPEITYVILFWVWEAGANMGGRILCLNRTCPWLFLPINPFCSKMIFVFYKRFPKHRERYWE